jgi:alkanesulfonate monooxygenase SsuD/methylene tetrahydromethanopterin reductase-like flavin-dependent oxidoreductase (luciferase family)
MLGNVIGVNDPVRMAEEIAMLDCYSGGRIVSGFVRGSAVEYLHAGIDPSESWERLNEAHDLILKCWTAPGPFRFEGKYYQYRAVNPWVLPMQKPHPDVWFPGGGSPESVTWAAQRGHPYMNLGALTDVTQRLKQVYVDTAREAGYKAGPGHFGYLLRALVADTDERAIELGRQFLWTGGHKYRGPREHIDPPGYQSQAARQLKQRRPGTGDVEGGALVSYDELRAINYFVVGNPDTVTRKLTETLDLLGPGYLLLCGSDGQILHADAMRSIELFGTEVIPALHEVKLQPYE